VAVREVDDGFQNLRLWVKRLREVGCFDGVNVPHRVRKIARHKVSPRFLEETVEPILAALVDLVPELHRRRELGTVNRGGVVLVELDACRVVGTRHREEGEVAHASLVLDALDAFVDSGDDLLERLHRGHRLLELDLRDAGEELRLHEVLRLAVDQTEEVDGLAVLAVSVLVSTEQVVELPVEIDLLRILETRDGVAGVLTDALDDVGRLGELRRELRQPEQRLVELEVVRLVGDLGEDPVARLEELEAVERDREVVLRDLAVTRIVARLTLVNAVEAESRFAPALTVEESLRGRCLFGHLTGSDRSCASSFVELDVFVLALLRRWLGSRCG